MAVDERARHELHSRLEEVLGGHASTMMAYLPRGEPVTKDDLEGLDRRLSQRMDGLEQRMDARRDSMEQRLDLKIELMAQRCETALHKGLGALRTEMVSQTRLLFFSMMGTLMTFGALVFAALRLA